MEPLRGGKAVDTLPEKAKKRIAEVKETYSRQNWHSAGWEQPEVTCVLSGMNSEMIRENVRIASEKYRPANLQKKISH